MDTESIPPPSTVAPLPAGMPPIPPASRLVAAERPHHHSHRHDNHQYFRKGRLWVIALFLAFRLTEALELLPVVIAGRQELPAIITVIASFIWTTALLVGVWMRQGWARLCLIVVAAIPLALKSFFMLQEAVANLNPDPLRSFYLPGASVLLYVAIIVSLLKVKSLRRLTSRSYA